MSIIGQLISPITGVVDSVLKRVLPAEKVDEKTRLEISAEMQKALLQADWKEVEARAKILVAEIQGSSAAQRNWRPHLMYLIMGLMVFNGVLVPLINAFTAVQLPVLQAWSAIPDQMWQLLTVSVGGYVGGRTIEKAVDTWKSKS
ncbi:hypothetical protein CR161_03910 [Prosthecochloris sp. ZM]|uniref:3TM-type holin n=1 Tax=Prosthecochloris sp. ZM TaxID=2283143 RepID=UPI000DF8253B|nr:3TM-type holin [Prosthecochloris sp. ZM]RDD29922.1 hypothetical protein CR161_03910 [Prosthecochloris sp. ZM]